ncbi:MAG: cytochrome c [Myxococcota bacterium]|nr:cytochrome c [Myxococcota bacterium]
MSRPSTRRGSHVLFGVLLILMSGSVACWEQWSESWFPQMKWQKAVQAFERVQHEGRVAPFTPPEGTVPIDPAPPIVGRTDVAAAALLENPIPADFKSVARGQELYGIFCETCHGATGMGDGPVSIAGDRQGPFVGVWPLGTATGQSDGYIYNLIRVGNGGAPGYRMPSYKHIPDLDRWHLVNYVRYLQQGGQP